MWQVLAARLIGGRHVALGREGLPRHTEPAAPPVPGVLISGLHRPACWLPCGLVENAGCCFPPVQ